MSKMQSLRLKLAILAAVLVVTAPASHAAVSISAGATTNIVCSAGVCTPTAGHAVLNVTELANLLAAGNVKVTTGRGTRGAKVQDIVVAADVSWAGASILTLDAYHSLIINRKVTVAGQGNVNLVTNDGGTGGELFFDNAGKITFPNPVTNPLINGVVYQLCVDTCGPEMVNARHGNFALAHDYDASADGTYTRAVVTGAFYGHFNGLGNTISNLSIDNETYYLNTGFFEGLYPSAVVEGVHLAHASIKAELTSGYCCQSAGIVAALNRGLIRSVSVSGSVKGRGAQLGGIAGTNEGSIAKSSSAANITGYGPRDAGGLVGFNYGGSISTSFSTGVVSAPKYVAGGLVGVNSGASIVNSYATGAVTAKVSGGLVGQNSAGGQVAASYATGTATASGPDAGGFVGLNDAPPAVFTDCYWDTTTSGTAVGVGSGDATGVTGLTTDQLVSGLPSGFASAVWAENPAINGGRPYLLSNRPR